MARRRRAQPPPVEPLSDFSSEEEFPTHHRRLLDSDDEHYGEEDEDLMQWSDEEESEGGSSDDDEEGYDDDDFDDAITEDTASGDDAFDIAGRHTDDDDEEGESDSDPLANFSGSDDDESVGGDGRGSRRRRLHQHSNFERSRQIPELRTIMRRLLRLEDLLTEATRRSMTTVHSPTVPSSSQDASALTPTLDALKETQMFLWSRFVRMVADEHRRSSDRYSNTLNFHDRSAFEHLTHTVHRNTKFCELLEAACIVGAPLTPATTSLATPGGAAGIEAAEGGSSPLPPPSSGAGAIPTNPPAPLPSHHEGIGKLAQYATCLISEGTREALLSPLGIVDLIPLVVREPSRAKRLAALSLIFSMFDQDELSEKKKLLSPLGIVDLIPLVVREPSRAKRLAALSLIFSMFDQDELSVGDAMAAGLHKVLLQRSRSTVGHMFDLNTIAPPLPLAVRSGSPMLQAAPWRPAVNPGSPVLAAPPSPIPRAEVTFVTAVDDGNEPAVDAPLSDNGSMQLRKRTREEEVESGADPHPAHRRRGGTAGIVQHSPKPSPRLPHQQPHHHHRSSHQWEPRPGDIVGRGPGWKFKDQGARCDCGVIVDVFEQEVLVRWRVSADHVAIVSLLQHVPGLGPEDRLFRYRYTGPFPEVVSWTAYLRARTMQPTNVSVKLEELLLMGAILGVLCNQKDCVLPCFQFQTVECMLALVDVQVVNAHEKYAALLDEMLMEVAEYREACVALADATTPPDGSIPVPAAIKAAEKKKRAAEIYAIEDVLPFNSSLNALEAHFRSQRELAARGLWVLNSLLQHKKLALVFLERNGLDRVLQIGQSTTITTIMYGCSLIISQLARPAVLEEVLQRQTHLFTHTMAFAMKCLDHSCADIKGSAAAFFFHALGFPLVLMHFDANGGLAAALRLFQEVVATNDATHDIVNPTLCLVMLRGFGTYLNAHMLLQTRVLFAEHRSLASVLHRPATSALPTRDTTLLDVVSTILTSTTETAMRYLTGVMPETFRRITSSQNIHAYRTLIDLGFHTLLLKCVIFYRDQDRFDLLNATLTLLKTFVTFPFTRKAIAMCDESTSSSDATSRHQQQQQQQPPPRQDNEEAIPRSRGNSPSQPLIDPVPQNEETAAATGAAESPTSTTTAPVVRSIPTLLLVMEDLNATNRESVQAVVGALQVLLLMLTPPRDSQDESGAMVFAKVCASVRSNDGIRVLLDLLRPRNANPNGTSSGSATNSGAAGHRGQMSSIALSLFPVVAHVVHILVRLVSNPGSDTHLLFRALDVHRIVKDVLQMYMEVPRMFGNKVVMHRHDVPINISLSQFVEHAKCLVMGHLPSLMHTHSTSFHHHQEGTTLLGDDETSQTAAGGAPGGQRLSANLRNNNNGTQTPTSSSASGPQFDVDDNTRRRGGSPSPATRGAPHRSDQQAFYPTYRAAVAAAASSVATGNSSAVGNAAKDSSELLSDPFEVMERQEIVNRSTLEFTRPSLLKLISSYLESEGLTGAAAAVKEDAKKLDEAAQDHNEEDQLVTTTTALQPAASSAPLLSASERQTLPGLVKSYLRFQQSTYASHPIATLPAFDLTSSIHGNLYAKVTDVTRRRNGAARNAITRTLKRRESLGASRRCRAYDHSTFFDSHRFLFDVRGANDDELSALSITFCDGGGTIAIGTSEGGIALFDTTSGEDISGTGEKLLEQHIIFEDGGVVDVIASPSQQLIAAVRDLSGSADGGGSLTQLMRRDAMPISILSIADCRTVRFAEHHDHLLVGTMDTASKCVLYDLNRVDIAQVFTDTDSSFSASENFKNVASLDATGNLVLSDATLWDRRCPTRPLHHFDRITEHFSGIFHPNNRHVIIDKSVWDLRTLTMLLSCPAMHQSTIHAFDYGSRLAAFQEPDYSRSSSVVTIIDGQTYETARTLDMKPLLRSFATSKTGVLFAGIQDSDTEVSVRIYSFGMEADEERYIAESEEPVEEDDLDGSDSELDLDDDDEDDDLDEAEDVSSSSLYSSNDDNEEDADEDADEDEDDEDDDDDSESSSDDSGDDDILSGRLSSRRLSTAGGSRGSGSGPSGNVGGSGGAGGAADDGEDSDGAMST
ncbi:Hypothetical protein, putative [Bodo saltans]|uniref:Uncharacterized protein n=1 Tax=Bodo saltans TaxID=75058 RepID=A0A0S4IYH1_BODSA|nr:Hypothetical protein, putative [Bodo saltans]|eukprot:CUG18843.1 Hypothetical protein, putative [Bodo saltans]